MKNKKIFKKIAGLTLVEILVSMVIFALIMAGLANLFTATKRITLHIRYQMTAAELGRRFLDRLQMHVRQDWWSDPNNPPNNPTPNSLLTVGNYRTPNLDVSADGFPQYDGFTPVTQAEEDGFEEPFLDNISYYPVYEISNKDGLPKVKLTICWQEPSP